MNHQPETRGGDPKFSAKRATDSQITLTHQTNPADANPLGAVHGGVLMKLVDEAGGLAAIRFARKPAVTVALDSMTFLSPVRVGNVLTMHASVNWVGKSSIEVGVRVEAENPVTGEITHTNTAYLVYVAVDENGKPSTVPPLILETAEEKRRWEEADARQKNRLARAKK